MHKWKKLIRFSFARPTESLLQFSELKVRAFEDFLIYNTEERGMETTYSFFLDPPYRKNPPYILANSNYGSEETDFTAYHLINGRKSQTSFRQLIDHLPSSIL